MIGRYKTKKKTLDYSRNISPGLRYEQIRQFSQNPRLGIFIFLCFFHPLAKFSIFERVVVYLIAFSSLYVSALCPAWVTVCILQLDLDCFSTLS